MSTHNIGFHGEIRIILSGCPVLSEAMISHGWATMTQSSILGPGINCSPTHC